MGVSAPTATAQCPYFLNSFIPFLMFSEDVLNTPFLSKRAPMKYPVAPAPTLESPPESEVSKIFAPPMVELKMIMSGEKGCMNISNINVIPANPKKPYTSNASLQRCCTSLLKIKKITNITIINDIIDINFMFVF